MSLFSKIAELTRLSWVDTSAAMRTMRRCRGDVLLHARVAARSADREADLGHARFPWPSAPAGEVLGGAGPGNRKGSVVGGTPF